MTQLYSREAKHACGVEYTNAGYAEVNGIHSISSAQSCRVSQWPRMPGVGLPFSPVRLKAVSPNRQWRLRPLGSRNNPVLSLIRQLYH